MRYEGATPLAVRLVAPPGAATTLRGLAAVVSPPVEWWLRDERFVSCYVPVPQAELLRVSRARPIPAFIKLARSYADTMLLHGRDRHGAVHSPLFSSSLTREAVPQLTPYPLYAEYSAQEKQTMAKLAQGRELAGLAVNPFNRFYYDRVLNYPKGLGNEGPHKTTVYGSDPFEDRPLLDALFALSRATGEPAYARAAGESLTWWYAHTQGAGGLYPWGEHAGWDLVNECPTYYAGPSQGFFEANYHEVRDFPVYPEYLRALPATKPYALTPLDAYALGIWQHHFWDKEKGFFNRHGDINGIIDQIGDGGGFPAHLGYYLHVWGLALATTKDASAKAELRVAFQRTLAMAIARTEKHGFFPFSFDVELRGADPGREASPQSLRLAHHAFEVAAQVEAVAPGIAASLRHLARLHLKAQPDEITRRNLRLAHVTGDVGFLAGKEVPPPGAAQQLRDFSDEVLSESIAQEIINAVQFFRDSGRREYLDAAEAYARIAHETYCDERSPLPRALRKEVPLRTAKGEPFPDFYYRGSKLMRAFVELGEALAAPAQP